MGPEHDHLDANGNPVIPGRGRGDQPAATRSGGQRLKKAEVREMVEVFRLGPFLSLEEAAAISRQAPRTLQNHVSEGRYPESAIKGKPLQFITLRFLEEHAARVQPRERGRR